MKKLFIFTFILSGLYFTACKDAPLTHMHGDDDPEYHVHIMSPNTDDKHVGDTIHIHVNFDSHTMETVHHVKVRIYNKADMTEIYNMPSTAHVHETDGEYEFHDDFILSDANGVNGHTDWILEAKVWGHMAGEHEVIETREFHVHP